MHYQVRKLFIGTATNKTLPSNLQNLFKIAENQHTDHTRTTAHQQITLAQVRTTSYGLHSVT